MVPDSALTNPPPSLHPPPSSSSMVYDVTLDQLSTVEFRDSQSGAVYCAAFARALGKLVVVAAAGVRDNGHLPFFFQFLAERFASVPGD